MGVNSLPKTVTRQRRDCDLNPGPSAPESSRLTTRLPGQPSGAAVVQQNFRSLSPTDLAKLPNSRLEVFCYCEAMQLC